MDKIIDINDLPLYTPETPQKESRQIACRTSISNCAGDIIDLNDKEATSEALAKLDDAELAEILDRAETVEKFISRLKEERARRIDDNGGEWCGWTFKEVSGGREIADVQSAFQAVSGDMDAEDFLACCKVSVPTLEKTYAHKMKLYGMAKSDKEGVAMLRDTLTDLIVEKPPKRMIVRK